EAFLKMHLKLDTFNQQSKFSTWLYSVTVNVALDMLRKNAKHRQCSDYDFDQIASSDANAPEKAAWLSNVGSVTAKAVNLLNDDLRVAFILRHYEERSIEEISQILDLNASTVKSRIFRAVGRLRKTLQPKVGDYETVD
ncbi:MAG: RNA polymerase sigma factor, partial [Arenicella sp.]|nr:RNA polymerase sigma factor [Arenicella sp.]